MRHKYALIWAYYVYDAQEPQNRLPPGQTKTARKAIQCGKKKTVVNRDGDSFVCAYPYDAAHCWKGLLLRIAVPTGPASSWSCGNELKQISA